MKYYATFKSDPFTEKCLIYAILPKKKDVNQVYLYKFLWILFESCNGLKNLHLSKTKKCISGKISYIKQASDFRQTHESHTCWFTHFLCLTWYHPTTFHLNKKKNGFRAIGLNENSFITLGIFCLKHQEANDV